MNYQSLLRLNRRTTTVVVVASASVAVAVATTATVVMEMTQKQEQQVNHEEGDRGNPMTRLYSGFNTTHASCEARATTTTTSTSTTGTKTKDNKQQASSASLQSRPKLIFLGTGSSTGCPRPLCSLVFPPPMLHHSSTSNSSSSSAQQQQQQQLSQLQQSLQDKCQTSIRASHYPPDPRYNKDYRNNPSLLIQFPEQMDGDDDDDDETTAPTRATTSTTTRNTTSTTVLRNVIIDVGKTFRETAIRWMPYHDIYTLDAVILSHHHMDAVAGLDDLRGFQHATNAGSTTTNTIPRTLLSQPVPHRRPIPIYLSQECLTQVSKQFPWLFPKQIQQQQQQQTMTKKNDNEHDGPAVTVQRDVAALDVHVLEEFQPFFIHGLQITPLPVWHGEDLICLGYSFSLTSTRTSTTKTTKNPLTPARTTTMTGKDHDESDNDNTQTTTTNIVYLSDISRMREDTLEYIQTQLPPTDILICDALLPHQLHPVHYSMDQAIALSKLLQVKQAVYLIGMNCDAFLPHEETNRILSWNQNLHDTNTNANSNANSNANHNNATTTTNNTPTNSTTNDASTTNTPTVQLAYDGLVLEF